MPPDVLDFSKRADLTELMDAPCSRDVMQACLRDLSRVNRWFLAYRPTLNWLESLELHRIQRPIRIIDVGCGYGDTLRRIEAWGREHKIHMMLTGCDLNPESVAIAAAQATPKTSAIKTSAIEWVAADVFSYRATAPFDIVVSSQFTHHLVEGDIIRFIQWMEEHARAGWFINDLSRAQIPYHLFKAFAKLASLHPFVQHDGPVSIARSFVPQEWLNMCAAAGIPEDAILIQAFTPARLCVGRKKPQP
jgi:SAM-dependent methyltransferase